MGQPTVILSTSLPGNSAAADLEQEIANACRDAGLDVITVPHLYHLPEQSPLWSQLAGLKLEPLIVLAWMHPRPLQWLLRRHGISPLETFNLASIESAADFAKSVGEHLRGQSD